MSLCLNQVPTALCSGSRELFGFGNVNCIVYKVYILMSWDTQRRAKVVTVKYLDISAVSRLLFLRQDKPFDRRSNKTH